MSLNALIRAANRTAGTVELQPTVLSACSLSRWRVRRASASHPTANTRSSQIKIDPTGNDQTKWRSWRRRPRSNRNHHRRRDAGHGQQGRQFGFFNRRRATHGTPPYPIDAAAPHGVAIDQDGQTAYVSFEGTTGHRRHGARGRGGPSHTLNRHLAEHHPGAVGYRGRTD